MEPLTLTPKLWRVMSLCWRVAAAKPSFEVRDVLAETDPDWPVNHRTIGAHMTELVRRGWLTVDSGPGGHGLGSLYVVKVPKAEGCEAYAATLLDPLEGDQDLLAALVRLAKQRLTGAPS